MTTDHTIPPQLQNRETRDLIPSSTQDLLAACFRDFGLFCTTFLPHRFRPINGNPATPFTSTHRKIIDLINGVYEEQRRLIAAGKNPVMRVVVIGARGIAKSSFIELGLPLRDIFYQQTPFHVPVTHSLDNTILHSEALRKELVSNEVIQSLIKLYGGGSVRAPEDSGVEETFGKKAFVACIEGFYSFVMPRGRGQAIFGNIYNHQRPWTIVIDDLQLPKLLKNEAIREEDWQFVVDDALKSFSQLESELIPSRMWLFDTAKNPDTVCERAMDEEGWIKLRIPVMEAKGSTLDPEFVSQETLDKEATAARKRGRFDKWASEKLATCVASEDVPFKKADFRYYREAELALTPRADLFTMVLADPARTANPRSAFTGLSVWSVNTKLMRLYHRAVFGVRLGVDEQGELAGALCQLFDAELEGVEITGLGLFGSPPYTTELARRGLAGRVEFMELQAKTGKGEFAGDDDSKDGRLLPLGSYYKWGQVYHNEESIVVTLRNGAVCTSDMRGYENQLLLFSASKYRDMSDAAAYVLFVLSKKEIFFSTPQLTVHEALSQHGSQRDERWTRMHGTAEEALATYEETDPSLLWNPDYKVPEYSFER